MKSDFECRLAASLADDLAGVDEFSVKRTALPAPARGMRRDGLAMLVTAAAVLAVVLTVGFAGGGLFRGGGSTVDAAAAAPVSVGADHLDLQGVWVPIPDGWQARAADGDRGALAYCLYAGPDATSDCLYSGGILVQVAPVVEGQPVEPVPGAFESPECAGEPIVPILDDQPAFLGGAPATRITVGCGDDQASTSTYWAALGRTVKVQSPFDGAQGRAVAENIVSGIDLSARDGIPFAANDAISHSK